jgi:6-phosphogluconolactonase
MDAEIIITPDAGALAQEAAKRFSELAREAVESRGRFSAALSGGSTPGSLYELLAAAPRREQIPWSGVYLFWGDERCVPPSDPASNYRLAEDTLIRHVPIPSENLFRIRGELSPEAAARNYDKSLQDFFCGPRPRFDLVLLGLGSDGHTASLFPASSALAEFQQLAVPVEAYYQDRPAWRVTLTLPAINTARHALFLVQGSDKAEIVRTVLADREASLPAQQVRPSAGQLTWILDAPAASLLQG